MSQCVGVLKLPVIDFSTYFDRLGNQERYLEECKKAADALHRYGVCVVSDPRVLEKDNDNFLDMMEQYYEGSDGFRDARPHYHYQVGVTPSHVERARNHCKIIGSFGPDNKPLSPCPPEKDPKWRFFWRVGPSPEVTNFPSLNMDAVIPPEFPQWKEVMDMWGYKMLDALVILAEMIAVGFGIPEDSFTSKMMYGPHLLAPTGSDFNNYGDNGTVLAGFHYDLNFLTIHGKSRFPGLNIWTREGCKTSVEVPDGCLLVQAGKQIEYLTGGHVLAGYHEVIVNNKTVEVINKRKCEGKSLWRVSSTCFGHIQSDQILEPIECFKTNDSISKYPTKFAGDQVREELQAVSLDSTSSV